MRFTKLPLRNATLVEIDPQSDERGLFARAFCEKEFSNAGLPVYWPQINISFNPVAGTVRGMHFQVAPHEEPKLVRCTRGRVYDVIIDLRVDSLTYCKHFSIEISADNRKALFIPPGFAHGFQTLEKDSEILYLMGASYMPEAQSGVRWSDPAFDISWPKPVISIAERDASFPNFIQDRVK